MEAAIPKPCPDCGTADTLTLRTALVAQSIGGHSLAGVQTKVSARQVATLACSACGMSRKGRLEGVRLADDGQTVVAGDFVQDEEV